MPRPRNPIVTHVSGLFCYLCPRFNQPIWKAPHGYRRRLVNTPNDSEKDRKQPVAVLDLAGRIVFRHAIIHRCDDAAGDGAQNRAFGFVFAEAGPHRRTSGRPGQDHRHGVL